MEDKSNQSSFDRGAWFERQVRMRTRAALNARGSKAKTCSPEYRAEYLRQSRLFRAERAAVKQRKREKHLARLEKQQAAHMSA